MKIPMLYTVHQAQVSEKETVNHRIYHVIPVQLLVPSVAGNTEQILFGLKKKSN